MKKYFWGVVVLLLLIAGSCKDKSTNPEDNEHSGDHTKYTINGTLICNKIPLPNAMLSLKGVEIIKYAYSNSEGQFSIQNIPPGEYTLYVEKHFDDISFITSSFYIYVKKDTMIGILTIPKPLHFLEPVTINESSIKLIWSSTDATHFKEYKLYRKFYPNFDENTATLIHTFSSISDTSFIDNSVNYPESYYYKVYMYNDSDRTIGYSNESCGLSFPLDIGNKFYYQASRNPDNGLKEVIKEITGISTDGSRLVSVKNLAADSIYFTNETWKFSNKTLNVYFEVFNGNLLADTAIEGTGFYIEYNLYYDIIFDKLEYSQFHHIGQGRPEALINFDSNTANHVGIYYSSKNVWQWMDEWTENCILIGYIDKGVLFGDTVLSKSQQLLKP